MLTDKYIKHIQGVMSSIGPLAEQLPDTLQAIEDLLREREELLAEVMMWRRQMADRIKLA